MDNIPGWLDPALNYATDAEMLSANDVRRSFLFPNQKEIIQNEDDQKLPYMEDAVRAFRLVRGAHAYAEIGTFDKGNLAYVSSLLADDAIIFDIDIESHPNQTEKLKGVIGANQRLVTIVGSSTDDQTFRKLTEALDGQPLDALFIDGNHLAEAVISDFAMYGRLVRHEGIVLFHDSLMARSNNNKPGVAKALNTIDRVAPIYLIQGTGIPVHRFLPTFRAEIHWGVFGAHRKGDRA